MINFLKKTCPWLYLCLVCFTSSGCFALAVGAAAGAGGIIWAKGALHQEFTQSLDQVYKATKTGLSKLDLPMLVDRKDDLTAKLESEFADGKRVWIDIDYVSKYTTKVSIRVGTLGDEVRSREIATQIMQNLK